MSIEPQGRPNRGGRPPVGDQVKIAFPADLLDRIDTAAEAAYTTRSEWIRRTCAERLDSDRGQA